MNDNKEGECYLEHVLQEFKNDANVSKIFSRLSDMFILSFSCEFDDSAQWDRYGDGGFGVCLEFNYDDIIRFLAEVRCKSLCFSPVRYHNENENDSYWKFIAQYLTRDTDSEFITRLAVECCSVKHHSFRNEKEVRVIVDKQSVDMPYCSLDENFMTPTGIKTKLRLRFICENVLSLPINEIITGPKFKEQSQILKKWIYDKFGLSVGVINSCSSIR